ncbi:tRNA pseudouridine(38-40) synthase TruA [Paenibacillus herberti]|uniref:tRNA pseudouridine synthase A n=1 Tax=Paenibacillus herberti TaxID=1619309 RepID=A0A229NZ98_9BACL|nr:tRNA pseudouridine(38-40) synthase TruA [Paenibacillus herberti]OXM15025.1 tRNA pseudouridine(38-40) synthase TruA [Paenibacillus herberti]
MRNIRMKVAYDGTGYYGFQAQPGGNTVQDAIEQAIETLTETRTRIIGSGRTDARVHALGQVFNFHTESRIAIERWGLALNARLPHDIRIVGRAEEVPLDFHSRFSAKRKTYRYSICTSQYHDVFRRNYELHHPAPVLDRHAMRIALEQLVGEHDFTSFTTNHYDERSHVRTIYSAELREEGHRLDIFVTGNGFLYNMVRIIAGTLIRVGQGKIPADSITSLLEARDRVKVGPTAVPYGLTLIDVDYSENTD